MKCNLVKVSVSDFGKKCEIAYGTDLKVSLWPYMKQALPWIDIAKNQNCPSFIERLTY